MSTRDRHKKLEEKKTGIKKNSTGSDRQYKLAITYHRFFLIAVFFWGYTFIGKLLLEKSVKATVSEYYPGTRY